MGYFNERERVVHSKLSGSIPSLLGQDSRSENSLQVSVQHHKQAGWNLMIQLD